MKKSVNLFSFIVLLFLSASVLKAQSADDMKKWADAMTPGEQQKGMAKMTGEWKFTSKFWMAPGQEPVSNTGTARYEMLLGGRYQKVTASASMMGMPYEGIGITGYNNVSKLFESSWVDNFRTGVMYMTGTMDDKGMITMTGSTVDPITGKIQMERQTIRPDGDNKYIMEIYDTKEGQSEVKVEEIIYER
ncbi:MAG: DUF1579 domain-containing protein [Bacteroidetes bacterium]|nr:DUF1579 domain-containing protein [Bacteroidota bacterium]